MNAIEQRQTHEAESLQQKLERWPVGFAAIDRFKRVTFASEAAKSRLSALKQSQTDRLGQLSIVNGCHLAVAIDQQLSKVTITLGEQQAVFRLIYPQQPNSGEVLLVADPSRTPAVAAAERYGLSAAETEVARELANGRTLEDIAAQRDITKHTVRTQLRSIFKKTGTHRQGELIRLVLERS